MSNWKPAAVAAIVVGVIGVITGVVIGGNGGDDGGVTTTTVVQPSETTESTTPTTETTEPTETTEGVVPDVNDLLIGEAKFALRKAGYKIFTNTGNYKVQPGPELELVCAQLPEAGAAAEPGTQVKLLVRENCEAFGGG